MIGANTIKLERVFVDLKIASARFTRTIHDPQAQRKFEQARSLWDYVRAIKNHSEDGRALAIIGPPGCGKTTLLQYTAVTLASNQQRKFRVAAYLPIMLFLRDHVGTLTAKPNLSLGDLAQAWFSRSDRYANLNPPAGWFTAQLQRGECLVLLDGLDEVAVSAERKVLSRWVDQQIRNYPRCRFVITSRPEGYQTAPLERANVVEVQNFDWEKVKQFVKGWYLAEEIASASPEISQAQVRQLAERGAGALLQGLTDPRYTALQDLTVNPLLLTMIAMVHRYRNALPGTACAELYYEISGAARRAGLRYGRAGQRAQAAALVAQIMPSLAEGKSSYFYLALIYAGLGETESALQAREGILEERCSYLIHLGTEPIFDGLRTDARFGELLRTIGLPA